MATPVTSYILDAYKEFIIQNIDPNKISPDDLDRGLQFKENLITMYTHEFLEENIDNYEELENQAAALPDPDEFSIIKVLKGKSREL